MNAVQIYAVPTIETKQQENQDVLRDAIEVITYLGDSPLRIQHVVQPRANQARFSARGMVTFGAFLFCLGMFSFFFAFKTSLDNRASEDAWAESGQSMYDYRPARIGLGFDWLGFGGLGVGALILGCGLARSRGVSRHSFTVGRGKTVDAQVQECPVDSFALVEWNDGDVSLCTAPWLAASGWKSAGKVPVDANSGRLPFERGTTYELRAGLQRFVVKRGAPLQAQPTPGFFAMDKRARVYTVSAAMLLSVMVAMLFATEPRAATLSMDEWGLSGPIASIETLAKEDPVEKPTDGGDGVESGEGSPSTKEPPGRSDTPTVTRETGQRARKVRDAKKSMSRVAAMARVRKAGFLGAFEASTFNSLIASAEMRSGFDAIDTEGLLYAANVGESMGTFGLVERGVGLGGPPELIGTKLGRIGPGAGPGPGRGPGFGPGYDGRRVRRREPLVIRTKRKNIAVAAGLTPAIVRRYIQKKLPQVRNCYERELQVRRDLAGTVVTDFQISPKGKVVGLSASGLRNGEVEACVGKAIASVQFPVPDGGVYVKVRYPFRMSPK